MWHVGFLVFYILMKLNRNYRRLNPNYFRKVKFQFSKYRVLIFAPQWSIRNRDTISVCAGFQYGSISIVQDISDIHISSLFYSYISVTDVCLHTEYIFKFKVLLNT